MGVGVGKVGDPREMVAEVETVMPDVIADFDEIKSVVLEGVRSESYADGDDK